MKRATFFSCVTVLLLAVAPWQVQAQQGGNIKFGNLSIVPGFALQGIHDDNIYMGNGKDSADLAEKKESDWITHVKPSLLLNYLMPERGYINLGYQGDFAFYSTNDGNNWKSQMGNFEVDYLAPGGLIFGISELYTRSEDPFGGADQYNVGRISKRWTNDVKTKLGYAISSNFRSILYYNNFKQQYDDIQDYSQDYTDSEYGIGLETRFLPKTWGFLRYHYGQRKYNTLGLGQTTDEFNSDLKWNKVNAGLTWDPEAKLSGELNVGYQWMTYDHELTDAGIRRESKNTWVAATSINFKATETTTLALILSRAVRNTASDTNEQFTDTGIGMTVQQKLFTKFLLNAGLNYSKNEYNLPVGNERSDNNYRGNIGLDYNIQEWLSVGVAYNYNRKDSNIEASEFVDNQFMASLKIVY
ncbi:MAG: outer membrane beta-barrel protein [Deltaproteobacteria bacterium]|nr:outer membrane beta-barrel protein [Deltaproteobacteria bacterium]